MSTGLRIFLPVQIPFPSGSAVKNLPALQELQEMLVRSLGWEDPLEEGMATHSSILAWRIPWKRSLVGYSPLGCKDLDMTEVTEHGRMQNYYAYP